MSWMMAGATALSALSINDSNKKVGKAFEANATRVKNDYDKQVAQLTEMAESKNREVALEMSKVRFDGLSLQSSTTNKAVERGVVGASVARQANNSDVVVLSAMNALKTKAEDTMASIGVEMENKRADANKALYGLAGQASSQYSSGMETFTTIAGSAMSAYSPSGGSSSLEGSTISAGGFDQGMVNGSVGSYTTKTGEFVGV